VVSADSLVQYAADAALAVDANLRVTAWNARAEELLGYSEADVLGAGCWSALGLILAGGAPLCTPDCAAKLCFSRCLPYTAQGCRCRHKDGHWVDLDLSSITIPQNGASDGVLAILFLRPAQGSNQASPPSTGLLRIFTLGHFGLVADSGGIETGGWHRKQPLALLKYLVTNRGHAIHAEVLSEALWPGVPVEQGRGRLKVAVHFLRQQLRQAGVERPVIETRQASYAIRRDAVWVDADTFESLAQEGEALERRAGPSQALPRYRDAEALYRGEYLEEDPYADWCVVERERLRERYLGILEKMAGLYATLGMFQDAAYQCRKALVREPCREGVHRALMGYLWRMGRRDEALAQFRACAQVLSRELGAEPSAETTRLYQRILQSSTNTKA